jgi:hypothetical protein
VTYLKELFGQVVSSLLRNKLRSFLTMAGIAWGVASMVLIVAMGDGFKVGQRDRLKQLGENIVIVFPGRTEKQAGGRRAGRRIRLNYDDVRDIRAECFLVRYVVAELQNQVRAVSPFNSGTFSVMGVEPLYSQIRSIPVDRGRFLWIRTTTRRRGWRLLATTSGSNCTASGPSRWAPTWPSTDWRTGLWVSCRPRPRTAVTTAWTATRSTFPTPPWCATRRWRTRIFTPES